MIKILKENQKNYRYYVFYPIQSLGKINNLASLTMESASKFSGASAQRLARPILELKPDTVHHCSKNNS